MRNAKHNKRVIVKRTQRTPIEEEGAPTKVISLTEPTYALDTSYREDVRQLNRKFLLLAREMSRHDPEIASRVLGVPVGMQPIIAGLSLDVIDKVLAHPHVVQFTVRFPENYWGKISDKVTEEKDGGEDQMIFRVLAAAHSLAEGDK